MRMLGRSKTKKAFGFEWRFMKPTLKHRPAIWECMLGAVYAANDAGEVKYFDYDYEAAAEFAGVSDKGDLRVYRNKRRVRYFDDAYTEPSINRWVWWVE